MNVDLSRHRLWVSHFGYKSFIPFGEFCKVRRYSGIYLCEVELRDNYIIFLSWKLVVSLVFSADEMKIIKLFNDVFKLWSGTTHLLKHRFLSLGPYLLY